MNGTWPGDGRRRRATRAARREQNRGGEGGLTGGPGGEFFLLGCDKKFPELFEICNNQFGSVSDFAAIR